MGREENNNISHISEKNLDDSFVKSEKSLEKSTSSDMSYKTELCRTWVEKNYCPYKEKCRFAHGKKDLHEKPVNSKHYKQKECNSFYKKGFCPYGPRCHFKHEERKLKDISRPFYECLLKSSRNLEKILRKNLNYSGSISDEEELLTAESSPNVSFRDEFSFGMYPNAKCHFNMDLEHREINNTRNLPVFQKIKNNKEPSPVGGSKGFSHTKQTRKFVLHKNLLNSFM
jgi:hypothetical protein